MVITEWMPKPNGSNLKKCDWYKRNILKQDVAMTVSVRPTDRRVTKRTPSKPARAKHSGGCKFESLNVMLKKSADVGEDMLPRFIVARSWASLVQSAAILCDLRRKPIARIFAGLYRSRPKNLLRVGKFIRNHFEGACMKVGLWRVGIVMR